MKVLSDNSIFERLEKFYPQDRNLFFSSGRKQKEVSLLLLLNGKVDLPLYVKNVYYGKFDRAYYYRQEKLFDRVGVEFVLEGALAVRLNDRSFLVEPGEIFLIMPGVEVTLATGPGGFCRKYSFPVMGSAVPALLSAFGIVPENALRLRTDTDAILRLCEELRSPAADLPPGNSLLCYQLLLLLAMEKPEISPPQWLEKIREKMLREYHLPFTVRDLAAMAGCSESSFSRKFQHFYGESPHQTLTAIRMRAAEKILLESPVMPIKEVAEKTGYSNALYFSTAFRSTHHQSPREFRRQNLQCFSLL